MPAVKAHIKEKICQDFYQQIILLLSILSKIEQTEIQLNHFKFFLKAQRYCLWGSKYHSYDSIANRELKLDQCKCKPHYFEMEVQESMSYYQIYVWFAVPSVIVQKQTNFISVLLNFCTCKCTAKIFDGVQEYCFCKNYQKIHLTLTAQLNVNNAIILADLVRYQRSRLPYFYGNENRYQVGNNCVCKMDISIHVQSNNKFYLKYCKQQFDSRTSSQNNTFRILVSSLNKCYYIQRYCDKGQNEICQKFHYSCVRCNDILTKCEICSIESNRSYYEKPFTCDCNIGYYYSGIENCQKCCYSCQNCSLGGSNFCFMCRFKNIQQSHPQQYLQVFIRIMANQLSVKSVIFNVQAVQINITSTNHVLKLEKYKIIANVLDIMMQASNVAQNVMTINQQLYFLWIITISEIYYLYLYRWNV
ncbi:unnamed protein product [Paramecium sonneborni]|uniref:Transmembrane protein n=1 Tax=Paramecium sonneborni TaxID=65129 RepID=A0A8S1RUK2_9CILI|nr:unnamed protein product [Paramecium sonneborni]